MPDTFCLLKPDAFDRRLIPEILRMIDVYCLDLARMELVRPGPDLVREHYREHRDWEGFPALVDFTCSGPAVALVLSARFPPEDAVKLLRDLIGPYRHPRSNGSIRSRFMIEGRPLHENLVHGSDSPESAAREIELWFGRGRVRRRED
jgi:nucleoside-diphosphate kinase